MSNHQLTLQEINRSQSERYPQNRQRSVEHTQRAMQRSKSERLHQQQQLQQQPYQQNVGGSREELELRRAKRKSNAHLAAEAVQQERDAVRALKRLSMGGSLTIDPDLPFGIDNELHTTRQRRRRSSSSSRSSAEDLEDTTLIESEPSQGEEEEEANDDDNGAKINAEKLLWVPAKSHPSIAPDQFRRHVQLTLNDLNNKSSVTDIQKQGGHPDSSIPSLKELTDELDKLSEMAGLAATDAVTLARSLSSASSSASLLYGANVSDESLTDLSYGNVPLSPTDDEPPSPTLENSVDQDAPMFTDSSSSLKRNQWATYSRSRRAPKKDYNKRQHSPLVDDQQLAAVTTLNESDKPETDSVIIKKSSDITPQQKSQQRSVSENNQFTPRVEASLSRSHSEASSTSLQAIRTNHSRNRHAGSSITLESTQQHESLPSSHPHHQAQPLAHQHHYHPQQNQQPHYHHHQQQQHHRQQLPHQQQYPQQNQQHSQQHHHQQQLHHHQQQLHHHQHREQLHQQKHRDRPPHRSKKNPQTIVTDKQRRVSPLSTAPIQVQSPSPTQDQFRTSPITHQFPAQQQVPPPPQQQQQQPMPSDKSPTSLMDAPVLNKDTKKESKSKEFLNLFKMKRSFSPKSKESTKIKALLSGPVNDENVPINDANNDQIKSNTQPHENQRPALRSSNLQLNKGSQEQQVLQDSVKIIPKHEMVSDDHEYRTGDPRAYDNDRQKIDQSPISIQQRSPPPPPSPPQQQQQDADELEEVVQSQDNHRFQKESLVKKLSMENIKKSTKPNAPVQFTDSAFGFPLPPLSHSTLIMLDYRFPVHVERALYRLSHLKLANPKRPLRQQVLLSNFMYAYLNLVNHTLYLQQLSEEGNEEIPLDTL